MAVGGELRALVERWLEDGNGGGEQRGEMRSSQGGGAEGQWARGRARRRESTAVIGGARGGRRARRRHHGALGVGIFRVEELYVVMELLDTGKGREDHGGHGGSERRRRAPLGSGERAREARRGERGAVEGVQGSAWQRQRRPGRRGGRRAGWRWRARVRARRPHALPTGLGRKTTGEVEVGWAGYRDGPGRAGQSFPLSLLFVSVFYFFPLF